MNSDHCRDRDLEPIGNWVKAGRDRSAADLLEGLRHARRRRIARLTLAVAGLAGLLAGIWALTDLRSSNAPQAQVASARSFATGDDRYVLLVLESGAKLYLRISPLQGEVHASP
jgi:hypothetical protein